MHSYSKRIHDYHCNICTEVCHRDLELIASDGDQTANMTSFDNCWWLSPAIIKGCHVDCQTVYQYQYSSMTTFDNRWWLSSTIIKGCHVDCQIVYQYWYSSMTTFDHLQLSAVVMLTAKLCINTDTHPWQPLITNNYQRQRLSCWLPICVPLYWYPSMCWVQSMHNGVEVTKVKFSILLYDLQW